MYELPQLYNVFVGCTRFVGPCTALFNQENLIELRTPAGVNVLTTEITGWPQFNGIDELHSDKVDFEKMYLQNQLCFFDLPFLPLTVVKVVRKEGAVH